VVTAETAYRTSSSVRAALSWCGPMPRGSTLFGRELKRPHSGGER
jgi:hypothetical protein